MSFLTDGVLLSKLLVGAETLVALGTIILVHEFGHFLAAKRSGMAVEEFSVGFGPTLWSWTDAQGTRYRVALILCMGYVRIAGMEGEEHAEDLPGSFYTSAYPNRVVVLVAGSVANLLFAALVFCLLYRLWGVPDVRSDTVIADVRADMPAAAAGIEKGWQVVSVDGRATPKSEDVEKAIRDSGGRMVTLRLTHGAEVHVVTVQPRLDPEAKRYRVGVTFRDDNATTNAVDRVEPGGPAAVAGLRRGDRLVALGGQRMDHPMDLMDALTAVPAGLDPDKPKEAVLPALTVGYLRDGREAETTLVPRARRKFREKPVAPGEKVAPDADRPVEPYLVGDAGFYLGRRMKSLGLAASVNYGVGRGLSVVREALKGLGLLAHGRKLDQVGGPVAILQLLSQAAGESFYDLFQTAAMLSIILGVMNLLPLPALDGGRLVFIFLEWAFRRPVIGRTREAYVHVVGLLVLLSLLLLITVRDLRRW